MIDKLYLEQVSKALRVMEAAGMSTFGKKISPDSVEAYAMVLAAGGIEVLALEKATLRMMKSSEDFPSAGRFYEVCKEIQGSLESERRTCELLANYQEAPALEASTVSGSVEKWQGVIGRMKDDEQNANLLKTFTEPTAEEIAEKERIIAEQIERLKAESSDG